MQSMDETLEILVDSQLFSEEDDIQSLFTISITFPKSLQ